VARKTSASYANRRTNRNSALDFAERVLAAIEAGGIDATPVFPARNQPQPSPQPKISSADEAAPPSGQDHEMMYVEMARGMDQSTFPFKLYEMLEYASNHRLASIVWTHDGEAFKIVDADAFMNDVAPLFFKQSKFRSFTRESISRCRSGTNVERPTHL